MLRVKRACRGFLDVLRVQGVLRVKGACRGFKGVLRLQGVLRVKGACRGLAGCVVGVDLLWTAREPMTSAPCSWMTGQSR